MGSFPSWEPFEAQSPDYQAAVLPEEIPVRVAVEAGATQGWHRWVGCKGAVIGLDRFGASAPGPVLYREFGFTPERIADTVRALLHA